MASTTHEALIETSGMLGALEFTAYCPCGWESDYLRRDADDAQTEAAAHVEAAQA